jgi:hypothetical protein
MASDVPPQELVGNVALWSACENALDGAANVDRGVHECPVYVEQVDGKLRNHSGIKQV